MINSDGNAYFIDYLVLIIGGFGYSIYAILNALKCICAFVCCAKSRKEQSEIPRNIFEAKNEAELQKIRNKRLEKFENFKQKTIADQLNVEAQLAKQLGLEPEIEDNGTNDEDECDEGDDNVTL